MPDIENLKIVDVKRLDHLPLVAACMRHLEIAKTIGVVPIIVSRM